MATFKDLSPYRWRKDLRDGISTIQRFIEVEVDGYGSTTPEAVVAQVAELGMVEPRLEAQAKNDYGDMTAVLILRGWVTAQKEDLRAALLEIDDAQTKAREWQERQAEELRRARPDLFA